MNKRHRMKLSKTQQWVVDQMLSKTQQWVVDQMRAGWELGRDSYLPYRTWMQKGGIGRGGKVATVNRRTFYALWKAGVIEVSKDSLPTTVTYRLKKKR